MPDSAIKAAKALGLGLSSVYEAIRRREIFAVKIGKRLLIPKKAVEELLSGAVAGR